VEAAAETAGAGGAGAASTASGAVAAGGGNATAISSASTTSSASSGSTSSGASSSGAGGSDVEGPWEQASIYPEAELWSWGRIAAHPSDPSTIAVLLKFDAVVFPEVTVAISNQLGWNAQKRVLQSSSMNPALLQAARFVGYDPDDGDHFVVFSNAFLNWSDEAMFVTADGGDSFGEVPVYGLIGGNPLVRRAFFVPGPPAELAFVVDHGIAFSADYGATLSAQYDYAVPNCSADPIAVQPADHAVVLLGGVVPVPNGPPCASLCQAESCTISSLPAGKALRSAVYSRSDPLRVVAVARDESLNSCHVLVSSDAGASFTETLAFPPSVISDDQIVLDPRPGEDIVFIRYNTTLIRSDDGGMTWVDVSLPADLVPQGSYILDFTVAADGAVLGIGPPGAVWRLPAER
jgi:hypothetical protein